MQITLAGVTKRYEGVDTVVPAVDDVSLTVASGEFFFLLGPSGCGKTTLLRLIAGLIPPSSGRIDFDGRDVTDLPVDKRGAALVFQGYALWPHMSVRENVEFGPRMQGLGREERRRVAAEQLDRVQMSEFTERKPNQLSGGQQQRVALARALAAGTRALLFDEPLSNLDARLRLHMREELKRLVKSTGVTAVYVTHDQKEALSMADRVAVMSGGRIVQLGLPEEVYNRPATRFVADFLGEANFLEGRVVSENPAKVATEFGEITTADARDWPIQASVECCVRPEHVRIHRTGESVSADNALPAIIASEIYLGDVRQYVCEIGAVHWRVAQLAHAGASFAPGDRVELTFAASEVALLDRQST